MSLRIFTVAIDLLPAVVPVMAGYLQSCAGLNRTYVRALLSRNNFYNVKGLSFFHDGELITTAPEDRIVNLDEIPSPFQTAFTNNGLLGAASIPIQSMSDVELDKVGRSNIKKSTCKTHQEILDNYDINSGVRLLSPLPGETIESFRDELSDLCGSRADSLSIYPLFLINNRELNENEEKFGLVPAADEANIAGDDQFFIGTNEVSLENCDKEWGVAFAMVLLNNLRGLYSLANHLHHFSIRRYGDRFADLAKFLTAHLSRSSACTAKFLTTVFQPFRCDMVQAYGRLVHFLCHQARTVVDACLREFAGGVTRIKHALKQQPLSDKPDGSSWHWNYRSFRIITSRHLASWEETHVAAAAA